MKCANCGTETKGNFCSSCGAAMRPTECPDCGAKVVPGARFCNQCGASAGGTAGSGRAAGGKRAAANAPGANNLAWYIAAGVLVVVIIFLLVTLLPDRGGSDIPAGAMPLGQVQGDGTPPPLTGSPREQADRLFNRIMAAREQGDTANAVFFSPMGIQAYQSAEPLDDDGIYHLAVIHVVAGDYPAARAAAERILATNPNHLLALATAGEAAVLQGDSAAARDYYGRFLAAYDTEIGRGFQEYMDHSRVIPDYRETARNFMGS